MHAGSIRRFAANLLLLAVGCIAGLLLAEALVRRLSPQQRSLAVALRGLHRPDAELGYVMRSGFQRRVRGNGFACDVRINSLGLRDREPGPHAPGVFRIVGLGDSFVLGVHAGPPERSFVARLEAAAGRELQARPRPAADGRLWRGVEIVNAGVDGYGTLQEIGLLHRLQSRLHPDAVLLGFYMGNDFTDNSGRTRMTVVDGYQMLEASVAGYREHARPLHRRLRISLHAHSELYLLLKRRLVHPTRAALPRLAGNRTPATAARPDFEYFVYDAGFAHLLREQTGPDVEAGEEATRQAFAELRRFGLEHGVPVLVVALPAEQQVDAAARSRWLERFGLDPAAHDFTRPNRRLAALASQAGLPLVDLTPAFARGIAAGDSLYLTGDPHWNAAGHALAAEVLLEPVLRDLVAPDRGRTLSAR